MDDSINTYAYRNQECAGRSLATLLVSWVAVAMLGAILLRWEHMWIALTVLTLLFLMMCAYAIKLKRQTNSDVREERCFVQENVDGVDNQGFGRTTHIPTVSGSVDDFTEIIQPPAYQNYWINDLPPSYSAAIGSEAPPTGPIIVLPMNDNYATITSNPPPYCAVLQLESTGMEVDSEINPTMARNLNNSKS